MKIISKYKDYYDYLRGIYGEDPKLILDRRQFDLIRPVPRIIHKSSCTKYPPEEVPQPFSVRIGTMIIDGVYYKDAFYYGKDLLQFRWEYSHYDYYLRSNFPEHVDNENAMLFEFWFSTYINKVIILQTAPYIVHTLNPIAIEMLWLTGIRENPVKKYAYPILKDIGLTSVITPHEIWVELTSYLGQLVTVNEPPVPIGSDNIRIQSHGFDTKTSFRPKMK